MSMVQLRSLVSAIWNLKAFVRVKMTKRPCKTLLCWNIATQRLRRHQGARLTDYKYLHLHE